MHSLTRRTTRAGLVLTIVAAALLAFSADPAAAEPCGRGCSHNGNATGAGYSAAAAYVTARGAGGTSTPQPCVLQGHEAGLPEDAPPQPGHIEVWSYDNDGDGTYDVFVDCIRDGRTGIPDTEQFAWDVLEIYESVPALAPEELVEEALANMPVGSPDIVTSPGEGDPSLVGIDTWLMIDEASWTRGERTDTQGPISVTVWAEPDSNGQVLWDTGEGSVSCTGSGQPGGSCGYTYQRSSAGQGSADGAGRPAYSITASVSYTGGYAVSVFGIGVGGDPNLGNISRTSEPYFLAVDEAQALNTGG